MFASGMVCLWVSGLNFPWIKGVLSVVDHHIEFARGVVHGNELQRSSSRNLETANENHGD